MALSDRLDLYLRLERLMMDLDDRGQPFADGVRDLLDPLWYSMSEEEQRYLNSRGAVEVRTLYPVTLTVPDLFHVPADAVEICFVEVSPQDGVGRRFSLEDDVLCAA